MIYVCGVYLYIINFWNGFFEQNCLLFHVPKIEQKLFILVFQDIQYLYIIILKYKRMKSMVMPWSLLDVDECVCTQYNRRMAMLYQSNILCFTFWLTEYCIERLEKTCECSGAVTANIYTRNQKQRQNNNKRQTRIIVVKSAYTRDMPTHEKQMKVWIPAKCICVVYDVQVHGMSE